MLQIVDAQWKDHLYSLDHLKEGIGLRGYGQRDPLVEYKKESFTLFQAMKDRIDEEMVRYLWRLRPVVQESGAPAAPAAPVRPVARKPPALTFSGGASTTAPAGLPRGAGTAWDRRDRPAPVATTPRSRRSVATNQRSAATTRATAAAARSTRSAMGPRCRGSEVRGSGGSEVVIDE